MNIFSKLPWWAWLLVAYLAGFVAIRFKWFDPFKVLGEWSYLLLALYRPLQSFWPETRKAQPSGVKTVFGIDGTPIVIPEDTILGDALKSARFP